MLDRMIERRPLTTALGGLLLGGGAWFGFVLAVCWKGM